MNIVFPIDSQVTLRPESPRKHKGHTGRVVDIDSDENCSYVVRWDDGLTKSYRAKDLKAVGTQPAQSGSDSGNHTSVMNKGFLSTLAKRLFDGRVKTFIEVGFLTSNLEVTDFGKTTMAELAMEAILAKDDLTTKDLGDKLDEVAAEILADKEKRKKSSE